MGEAVVHATFGPLSSARRDVWTTAEDDFVADVDATFADDMIGWLLDELIQVQVSILCT
jgi:hypothetical protein